MINAKRFDLARIDKGELTPQGFLKAPAFLTRVGVFKYRKADGTVIRELRHPDDVMDPLSLASLQMAPVTDDHPKEFVTPDNVKKYSVGWLSEGIIPDAKKVKGMVVVADKNAIAKVDVGKVELSCGYFADLVEENGIYDGEPYDYRQKNIRYNHVALVERGRAGPEVRLRLDSADAEQVDQTEKPENDKETPEMKLKLGNKEIEVSQEVYDAITAELKTREDALNLEKKARTDAEEKLKEEAKKKDKDKSKDEDEEKKKMKEDNDKLQARVDALEEKVKTKQDGMTSEQIAAAVKNRVAIEKVASKVLGTEAKIDSKSDMDLMKEVISKHSPKTELKDKSDVYVKARFDGIAEEIESREDRRYQFSHKDSRKEDEFDAEAARKRNLDADRDLWKQPLAASKAK